MPRPKLVSTQPIFPDARAMLAAHADLEVNDSGATWSEAQVRTRCADAQGLLAFMTDKVDAAFLEACPDLRVIAGALKGFDNFDVAACEARGVWLTTVPDLLTAPTAELALGLAISLGRRIAEGDAHVRSGAFAGWRPALYGVGLAGSTVGIAGLGKVGLAIARRVAGFEPAAILGFDRSSRPSALGIEGVGWNALLSRSDFLFLALPLSPDARHLLGREALSRARPGQLIVNVGRGSVVDEAAIAEALAAGRIGGYAADVFEMEDWALAGHPHQIAPDLLGEGARTVLTPHLGSAIADVRRAIETAAAANLLAALRGEVPPDAINRLNPRAD
jgi:phosphonate dehydrogenase